MNSPLYTACFCEENIWQLGKSIQEERTESFNVLFLTNEQKSIALFKQKAVPQDNVIVWDYHVVLHDTKENLLYDYDTRLGFKNTLADYFEGTFPPEPFYINEYKTSIRVINLEVYLNHFSSNREHMIANGLPLQPMPLWPKIQNIEPLTLQNLWDLNHHKFISKTVSPEEYLQGFK
jgi:protein N-terminal glutamine amidohydrolase